MKFKLFVAAALLLCLIVMNGCNVACTTDSCPLRAPVAAADSDTSALQ